MTVVEPPSRQVDQDGNPHLSGLVLGADGAIPRETAAEAGLAAAEVAEQSLERMAGLVQPFEDRVRELPGLEILARADVRFQDHVLLDVEMFESGSLEALDGGFDVGAEVHQGEEELLEGQEADEFRLGHGVGVVGESGPRDEDGLIGELFRIPCRLHLGGQIPNLFLGDRLPGVLAFHEGEDGQGSGRHLQTDVELHVVPLIVDDRTEPL